jgi:hypothetical protein
MRGILDDTQLERELDIVRDVLAESTATHLKEFLTVWQEAGNAECGT